MWEDFEIMARIYTPQLRFTIPEDIRDRVAKERINNRLNVQKVLVERVGFGGLLTSFSYSFLLILIIRWQLQTPNELTDRECGLKVSTTNKSF